MKRIACLLMAVCLLATMMVGCGEKPAEVTTTTANDDATTTVADEVTTTVGDGETTTVGDEVTTAEGDDPTTAGKDDVTTVGKDTTTGKDPSTGDTTKKPDATTKKPDGTTKKPDGTTKKPTTTTTKKVTTTTKRPGATTRPPAADASNYEDVEYVIRQEATKLKLTKEVLDRSILYEGDTGRVASVIKKAMDGEDILIGYIGGSITQGSSATSASKKYADRFYAWFKETFPKAKVSMHNAGLGATDSLMGVHRVDNDLLSKKPDLVIVEFSVNDPNERLYRDSYEGLMRKILKSGAAVIAVQMMNQEGTNVAAQHSPITNHYQIPTISYKNALWPNSATKVYQWSEISPDSIHPNDTGHAIVSELLINYINVVRSKITKAPAPLTTLPEPKTDNSYENAVLLNSKNLTPSNLGGFAANAGTPQFPNGWYTSNGGDKTFTVEVTDAKNLSLLYWKQNGSSGTAIVKLDGKVVSTVKSDNSASWNYAQTLGLTSGTTTGKHTIEITCTGTFWILGILKS